MTRWRSVSVLLALSVLASAATISAAVRPGGPGNDVLRGTPGADKLYGKGGNDRLLGRAGNDLLVGGAGNDVLTGGRGADGLECGRGRDRANADRSDRVAKDCEVVKGITKPPPPRFPGQRIDVGGYSLYLECFGSGSPTVILEAGLGAPSATLDRAGIPIPGLAAGWRAVRAALASETRVCAYDRAGLGESDRRPSRLAPSATTYASELRTLLTNANVPGPYVVYGARFGGLLVLSYAAHLPNPNEIAGVVFSEALTPCPSACPYDFPPEHAVLDGLVSVHLGARPVIVLTSAEGDGPALSQRSTNSMWVSAPGASTYIPADKPQLTIEALRVVVATARTGGHLPPCDQTSLPTAGGKCESFG